MRGQSADGSVEWEEKWWSTAWTPLDYKELGAVKSGRDGHGNVWQESWSEISCSDVSRGFFTDASKKKSNGPRTNGAPTRAARNGTKTGERRTGATASSTENVSRNRASVKTRSQRTATRLDGTTTGKKNGTARAVA